MWPATGRVYEPSALESVCSDTQSGRHPRERTLATWYVHIARIAPPRTRTRGRGRAHSPRKSRAHSSCPPPYLAFSLLAVRRCADASLHGTRAPLLCSHATFTSIPARSPFRSSCDGAAKLMANQSSALAAMLPSTRFPRLNHPPSRHGELPARLAGPPKPRKPPPCSRAAPSDAAHDAPCRLMRARPPSARGARALLHHLALPLGRRTDRAVPIRVDALLQARVVEMVPTTARADAGCIR